MTGYYTNNSDISVALAVVLVNDEYDYNSDPYTISATTLLRPLKQIILGSRPLPPDTIIIKPDIKDNAGNALGSAFHDKAEEIWKDKSKRDPALLALGWTQSAIDKIVVNPDPSTDLQDKIPVYIEQRYKKKVGKWTVSGKFDIVINGRLEDYKKTKVYSYGDVGKFNNYVSQLSIYRWLAPQIITEDFAIINTIYSDYRNGERIASQWARTPYPESEVSSAKIPLFPYNNTELEVVKKINELDRLFYADEELMPRCTPEDLWQDPTVYKFYSNPEKLARATKNFNDKSEAVAYMIAKGNKGVIKEVEGKVKACAYCSAAPNCRQKDEYIEKKLLEI